MRAWKKGPKVKVLRSLVVVRVATLTIILGAGLAGATDYHRFSVGLRGDPEVGCLVATPDGACQHNRVGGKMVPEAEPGFRGTFELSVPGLRSDRRQPLGRTGRGRIDGVFTPAGGGNGERCSLKGSVRTEGVMLPGSSALRFYTGTFRGRGRCDRQPVNVRAIWSGGIVPGSDGIVSDFDRFEGRLAGTLSQRSSR